MLAFGHQIPYQREEFSFLEPNTSKPGPSPYLSSPKSSVTPQTDEDIWTDRFVQQQIDLVASGADTEDRMAEPFNTDDRYMCTENWKESTSINSSRQRVRHHNNLIRFAQLANLNHSLFPRQAEQHRPEHAFGYPSPPFAGLTSPGCSTSNLLSSSPDELLSRYPRPYTMLANSQPMRHQAGGQPGQHIGYPPIATYGLYSSYEDHMAVRDQQPGMPSINLPPSFQRPIPQDQDTGYKRPQQRLPQRRRAEQASPPTPKKSRSFAKSRVTKRNDADPKLPPRPSRCQKAKGPREYCSWPGCTESVARPIDIQRHKKTAHAGDDVKFKCELCANGRCDTYKAPKDKWVFPLKYNLTEHLRRFHQDTPEEDEMKIRLRAQREYFPPESYYINRARELGLIPQSYNGACFPSKSNYCDDDAAESMTMGESTSPADFSPSQDYPPDNSFAEWETWDEPSSGHMEFKFGDYLRDFDDVEG